MPRIKFVARRLICAGLLAAGCGGVCAVPAGADVLTAADCSVPTVTQPFLSWGDPGYYVLVPGQVPNNFTGDGWALTGGASVVTTRLADGSTGTVLDLPSGSRAVSPTTCVGSTYPTARTMVRNVVGGEGVQFYVSYQNTPTGLTPKNTGQVHGSGTAWTLSTPVNLQPGKLPGWQLARFTFVPGGKSSDFQIYNFYIDPYRKG
jgi:hypothetical protein